MVCNARSKGVRALSSRLPKAISLLAVLLLGSCERPVRLNASEALDLADAAQANARNALAQNEEQESEIDELKRKMGELESEVSSLQATARGSAETANRNARLLDQRWEAYQRHTH